MSAKDEVPSQPLRLIYDDRYDYIGNLRIPAYCWLRVYAPDYSGDLPVVVMSQMPDNPGTSITNFAEKLAWKIMYDAAVWAKSPNAAQEGCLWVQHYPEYDDRFSVVSFAYNEAAEADAGTLGTVTAVSEDPDDPDNLIIGEPHAIPAAGKQGTLGKPDWQVISRKRVEQMIGQDYTPIL